MEHPDSARINFELFNGVDFDSGKELRPMGKAWWARRYYLLAKRRKASARRKMEDPPF